jgi:peptidoglycan/LPS O-acetylase OafA/YrhL
VRFLLAAWVILLHIATQNVVLRAFVTERLPAIPRNVVGSGASAVGVFFLLSGFILAYSYDLGPEWDGGRRRTFWAARVARIYPVYLLALVLAVPSLVAGIVKGGGGFHPGRLLFEWATILLLVQAWIPGGLFLVVPAWSLSVEAFFYLCFPFAGRHLWKLQKRSSLVLAILGFWLLEIFGSYLIARFRAPWFLHPSVLPDDRWSEIIKFNPLMRLPEFLAGIVVCKLFQSLVREPWRGVTVGTGQRLYVPGMGIILLTTMFADRLPIPMLHDGLYLPGTAMMLVGLALGGGAIAEALSWRWMVLLGQASFAMYILHMPILSYVVAAGKRLPGGALAGQAEVFLPVVIVVSVVAFKKVEEPSRRFLLRKFSEGRVTRDVESALPVAADPF